MRLPDVRVLRRRARRLARWTGSIAYRTIVVPLLDREETEHAVDLACRLAADRGARIVLVAPAVLDRELPINAHLDGQLATLKERLESAAAVAVSYGVAVRREIVRTRPGSFGEAVARVAAERHAELVVVGAPVESRRRTGTSATRSSPTCASSPPRDKTFSSSSRRSSSAAGGGYSTTSARST